MRTTEGGQKQRLPGNRPEYKATFRDPWDWAERYIDNYEFEGVTPGSQKEKEILTTRSTENEQDEGHLPRREQNHLFRKMNYLRKLAVEQKNLGNEDVAQAYLDGAWFLRQSIAGKFFYIVKKLETDLTQKYPTEDPDRLINFILNAYYREIDSYDYTMTDRTAMFDNWAPRRIYAHIKDQVVGRKSAEPFPNTDFPQEAWEQMAERLEQRYDPERVQKFLELILQRLEQHAFGYKEQPLARILRARYLLNYGEEKGATLKEIGDAMGLTRERVRQLEKKAFEIIRQVIAKQSDVQPYLEEFNLDPEDIELLFLRKGGKPFTLYQYPAGSPGGRGPRKK